MKHETSLISKRLSSGRAAIALLSGALLIYQIVMTRILSVTLWYHWAFLCISMAMLGLGVSGVWFTLKKPDKNFLGIILPVSSFLIPLSVLLIFYLGRPGAGILTVMICTLSMFAPMLSLGAAVCLLLLDSPGQEFGRMYGCDLIGAFLGALLVIPLMHFFSAPQIVVLTALMPCLAILFLFPRHWKKGLILILLLLGLITWGKPLQLKYSKTYSEKTLPILYEKWTPTARLTVMNSVFFKRNPLETFGWGMGSAYKPGKINQLWLEQDGSAGTPITSLQGGMESLSFLLDDVTAAGYLLRPPASAAIIGPGGGRDILTASLSGARQIDAIELNEEIIRILSERFRNFSGDVYHLPGVHAVASDGRAYMTRTSKTYDLIQISLIDSWASTAAGAYTFSENNLYTVEAFRHYFNRLSKNGILSVSRWNGSGENISLALLTTESLRQQGAADPLQHILALGGGSVVTMLASPDPFSREDIEKAASLCTKKGWQLLFPKTKDFPDDSDVFRALTEGAGAFAHRSLDLRPSTDDRPFFFHTLKVFSPLDAVSVKKAGPNGAAMRTLQRTLILVSLITSALFGLPFILRGGIRQKNAGFWPGSFYFAAIGAAFMFVEMPWIQKFVLYLGHPAHATTTVLACLLLGAGTGSLTSPLISTAQMRHWGFLAPACVAAIQTSLSPVFEKTLGWPLPIKELLSLALLFPAGFFMGFFFPQGILGFGDSDKAWFWAVNGAAGVLAGVMSLALAMEFGFSRVLLTGVGLYTLAWLILRQYSATPELKSGHP